MFISPALAHHDGLSAPAAQDSTLPIIILMVIVAFGLLLVPKKKWKNWFKWGAR